MKFFELQGFAFPVLTFCYFLECFTLLGLVSNFRTLTVLGIRLLGTTKVQPQETR
jgi:hypothetical protein